MLAEVAGGIGLMPAGGGDGADDIVAGGEVVEGEVAVGVGCGGGIAGDKVSHVCLVDEDGPAGEAGFAGVDGAVGVEVVEDDSGDGGGCRDVAEVFGGDGGSADGNVLAVGEGWEGLFPAGGENLADDGWAGGEGG